MLVCALESVGLWNLGWDPGKADAAGLGAKVENQHSQAALLSGPSALMDRMVLGVEGGPRAVGCVPGFCLLDVRSIPASILPQL